MVNDPDIFRAAKLVMDQQGEQASAFADALLEEGDIDGSAGARSWRRSRSCSEEGETARR
jgi:hypothetical protein